MEDEAGFIVSIQSKKCLLYICLKKINKCKGALDFPTQLKS